MGSRVVQVKCPQCRQPIKGSGSELLFYCVECGALHTRTQDGKTETIEYEIAAFNPQVETKIGTNTIPAGKTRERVYIPFWQVFAQVIIIQQEVAGGFITKLAGLIGGTADGTGPMTVFVPAIELDGERFKAIATMLTASPPVYVVSTKFEVNTIRLPCTVTAAEALELADFIVLSNEAEKPGVLQKLSYEMKIQRTKLLFIPFLRADGALFPAL